MHPFCVKQYSICERCYHFQFTFIRSFPFKGSLGIAAWTHFMLYINRMTINTRGIWYFVGNTTPVFVLSKKKEHCKDSLNYCKCCHAIYFKHCFKSIFLDVHGAKLFVASTEWKGSKLYSSRYTHLLK